MSEAYECLSNEEKRRTYDQFGKQGLGGPGGGGGFTRGNADEIFAQFFGGQDPFSMFFGGAEGMPGMAGGRGGPNVAFSFQQMPGGGGGGMGGMGGLPPGFAGMMGGMPGMMGGMPGMGGMGGMPGMMPGMGGGGGGGRGTRRRRETPDVVPAETAVAVRGLRQAAQHNGKRGVVRDYDDAAQRYTVQLDDGEVLAIKFDNVLQLVDAEVTGTSRDEYNGKSCRVTGFDAEQLRYTCDLGGGKVLGLALDKVILPAGARARRRPHLRLRLQVERPHRQGRRVRSRGWPLPPPARRRQPAPHQARECEVMRPSASVYGRQGVSPGRAHKLRARAQFVP